MRLPLLLILAVAVALLWRWSRPEPCLPVDDAPYTVCEDPYAHVVYVISGPDGLWGSYYEASLAGGT